MNIPEGWPTEEMMQEGFAAHHKIMNGFEPDGFDAIAAAFKAMLAAAPTPPAPEVEPVAWMYTPNEKVEGVVWNVPTLSLGRLPGAETWKETPLYTHPATIELYKMGKENAVKGHEAVIAEDLRLRSLLRSADYEIDALKAEAERLRKDAQRNSIKAVAIPEIYTPTRMHSVDRTSPKGQPFAGRCNQCGKEGLTISDMHDGECANPLGITQEEALLEAMKEPK